MMKTNAIEYVAPARVNLGKCIHEGMFDMRDLHFTSECSMRFN